MESPSIREFVTWLTKIRDGAASASDRRMAEALRRKLIAIGRLRTERRRAEEEQSDG